MSEISQKKSGVAVLVGRSNVGKSTLLNSLVGTKIAITSPKPQTTRHMIHGIIHDPRGQVVFVDTPGVFAKVPDLMTQKLNEKARASLDGVDVVLYVVDPTRHIGEEEKIVKRMVDVIKQPKILVINKSDLKRPYLDEYLVWDKDFDRVIEISALDNKNLRQLVDIIFEKLPVGPELYPTGQLTDLTNNFWLEELIREKIFLVMHQEIPYSVTVEVEENITREDGTHYVKADILTSALRYKKMLIGHGGQRVKQIGQMVRKELELVSGKKAYLDLDVRVDERWGERFE